MNPFKAESLGQWKQFGRLFKRNYDNSCLKNREKNPDTVREGGVGVRCPKALEIPPPSRMYTAPYNTF